MATRVERLRAQLDELIGDADKLQHGLAEAAGHWTRAEMEEAVSKGLEKRTGKKPTKKQVDAAISEFVKPFRGHYEAWYSEAHAVVRQLLPDRVKDFELLYRDERRKSITYATYTLSDYLIGLSLPHQNFEIDSAAHAKFSQQARILASARRTFESDLLNIRGVLQADMMDSELAAARELHRNGYLRASGMVAGVVLEAHLALVTSHHGLTVRKKVPTLSTYNDALKDSGVIDIPLWRFIQRLADIRNLCGHPKERDPTSDEVLELIDGTDKTAKTLS